MGQVVAVALPPWGNEVKVEHDKDGTMWAILARGLAPAKGKMKVTRAPLRVHAASQCAGEWCCIHNPSDHPLKDADMVIRLDRTRAPVERVCEHGTGHPDPDSLAFIISYYGASEADGVHGCDGCC
jgi:hypothetical protein